MSKRKDVYVILTGGLGNQLFQISAALDFSEGNQILIDWKTANPRLNENGLPEIASFNLPKNITFLENEPAHPISKKAFSFLLSTGLKDRRLEVNLLYNFFIQSIGSLIFSFRFRTVVRILVSRSLGYELLISGKLSRVLIGYLQSYIWTEKISVLQSLRAIKSFEINDEYLDLEKRSLIEKPLIVHLRLGDYKHESTFGLLTRQYYIDAIKIATEAQDFGAIWVFSDEIQFARQIINFRVDLPIYFIKNLGNSTAINFEAMRLGHGFIIANSSFSWWAARLSKTETTCVIAPKPWFIALEDDESLIPPYWRTINGHGLH